MGSAPVPRNRPAMPDPRRQARLSLHYVRSLGYGREAAARRVLAVVKAARLWLALDGDGFAWWLDELEAEVRAVAPDPGSPTTDRQESDHGDRSTENPGQGAGAGPAET